MSPQPEPVRIVEVGPRDGLQNEAMPIATEIKLGLIHQLIAAGLEDIETTAFVSPRWVPQMADHQQLTEALATLKTNARLSVLTPNIKGYLSARDAGAKRVAVFAAASEAFSRRNINCSVDESLERFAPVLEQARVDQVYVRGYISCVLGCPYSGDVSPELVAGLAERLWEMGCREISLGDTIGVGTPERTRALVAAVSKRVPVKALAGHFHDTYGQALANVYAAYQAGVRVFDASVAGLGGCPYAPGASGNLATEDLLYMLQGMGHLQQIDLAAVAEAGDFICTHLGKPTRSKVAQAMRCGQAGAA